MGVILTAMIASSGLALQFAHGPGPLTSIQNGAPWLYGVIVALIVVAGLITQIKPLTSALFSVLRFLLKRTRLGDRDEAYRVAQRRLFARHVESQLDQLAGKEDWRDERFAELEAEVEVEGHERVLSWLRHSPSRAVTLRRERSLSAALARTTESLVILEGDPGSGKSVALRHLAHKLARAARKSHSAASLIPLYVNFKEFKPARRPVDSEDVREFILASLKRTNDRDVDRFLDEEFDRGLLEGTWLLLFDSFDEIPDVLSATDATGAVEEYARAIHDFLHGMKTIRAIVASREFRGPRTFRVPRFTIMPLSPRQQRDLVKRSGLRPEGADAVHVGLADADPDMRQLARNPMFLGLICEYVRASGRFPASAHSAYESYLRQRLKLDEERIGQRYGVGPDLVRRIAEEAAFSMAAVAGLGLSPDRRQLHSALMIPVPLSATQFGKVLDALEYTKLGRSPDEAGGDPGRRFTFAHRRFQEYFATCVVLREPGRVPVRDLLTNGQWRESAVTILQTQPPPVAAPLLDEAARQTDGMGAGLAAGEAAGSFPWPPGCLHLLQLMDAGLGRSPERIPPRVRDGAGQVLRAAWRRGRRHDRKWAADVALVADRETTLWLLEEAFGSGSVLLGGSAYAVASRMADPPASLYGGVRRALIDMAASGQLEEERVALKAQIRRLPHPDDLLRVLRMLAGARMVLIALAAVITAANCFLFWPLAVLAALIFLASLRFFPALFGRLGRWRQAALVAFISSVVIFYVQGIAAAVNYSASLKWHLGLVVLTISAFYLVWPFSVRVACSTGHMTRPVEWILAPLYLILHGCWRSVRSWRKLLGRRGAVALGIIVVVLAIEAGVFYFLDTTMFNPPQDVVIVTISALYVSVMSAAAVSLIRKWRHDRRLVRGLEAGRTGAGDLLRALRDAKTQGGTDKILEIACGRDAAGVPGLVRVLSDLSAVAEARERDRDAAEIPGLGPLVQEWLRADPKAARRVARWMRDSTLDRIARVVEQAELAAMTE